MSKSALERAEASVIVPAYNEEKVIGETLRTMLDGAELGELEVIVACNGCQDRTAEIARSFGPNVKVVETPEASKAVALNLGDAAATRFPRFYADADLLITIGSLRRVAATLRTGRVMAAAPTARVDMATASLLVRAFYAVWTKVPYFDDGLSGVYGLTREGRGRFGVFPRIISDDGFVDLQFSSEEREKVAGAEFVVRPPVTLAALMRMLVRIRAGSHELQTKYPELAARRDARVGETLSRTLRDPRLWHAVPLYAVLTALANWKGRRMVEAGAPTSWQPEASSRRRGPRK